MKIIKKCIVFTCMSILTFCVCLFAACGGGSNSSSTPTTSSSVSSTVETSSNEESSVEENATAYTIVVKYADGTPVEGVNISLCEGTNCLAPDATDASGTVVFEVEQANYHVTLAQAPIAGYNWPDVYTGEAYGTITITLTAK